MRIITSFFPIYNLYVNRFIYLIFNPSTCEEESDISSAQEANLINLPLVALEADTPTVPFYIS